MSGAPWTSPTRRLAFLAAAVLVVTAGFLSFASPAQAAKPCWEQVIDDWMDNGRIDGIYSSHCLEEARGKVPEDIRAYSDFEEKVDQALQDDGRSLAGVGGGTKNPTRPNLDQAEAEELSRRLPAERDDDPFDKALNPTQTSAGSFPLPLMILVGLALVLLTAGATGFAHRKLQARKVRAR